MKYDTELERELLRDTNGSDEVNLGSLLATFLRNPEKYSISSFREFSTRSSAFYGPPLCATRNFRVAVLDGEGDGEVVYGFIREGSDLGTSIIVQLGEEEGGRER